VVEVDAFPDPLVLDDEPPVEAAVGAGVDGVTGAVDDAPVAVTPLDTVTTRDAEPVFPAASVAVYVSV
jgi:hypothetical protein